MFSDCVCLKSWRLTSSLVAMCDLQEQRKILSETAKNFHGTIQLLKHTKGGNALGCM